MIWSSTMDDSAAVSEAKQGAGLGGRHIGAAGRTFPIPRVGFEGGLRIAQGYKDDGVERYPNVAACRIIALSPCQP